KGALKLRVLAPMPLWHTSGKIRTTARSKELPAPRKKTDNSSISKVTYSAIGHFSSGEQHERQRLQAYRAYRILDQEHRGCRQYRDRQGFHVGAQYRLVRGHRDARSCGKRESGPLAGDHQGGLHAGRLIARDWVQFSIPASAWGLSARLVSQMPPRIIAMLATWNRCSRSPRKAIASRLANAGIRCMNISALFGSRRARPRFPRICTAL